MSDWRPNPGSTDMARVLRGPAMRAAMWRQARRVRSAYASLAPRDSGSLSQSVTATTEIGGARRDRAVGVVTVSAPYAAAVEFGNRRTGGRGSHPLRRALRSVAKG